MGVVIGVALALALPVAAQTAGTRATEAEEARAPAAAGDVPEWVAPLASENDSGIGGVAFLSRLEDGAAAGLAAHQLRLELEPAAGRQAYSTYLREGTCAEPARLVVKAEPDLNARGEAPSVMKIPEGTLSLGGVEGKLPALVVEVFRQDGTRVACGRLLPAGAQEAATPAR